MEIPPKVKESTPVTEVAEIFISTSYRNLPITKGPNIVGVVSRKDVVKLILDIKEIRNVQVKDIMSTEIKAVQEKSKIKEAMELMSKLDIRTIPVVDTDFRLTGIIGIRDIIDYSWGGSGTKSIKKGAYVPENNPVEITVSSLMHDSPITIGPSDTLGDSVKLMVRKNISTLPVVENDVLKGVITKYDVLEMIASVRIRDMVYMQISGLEEEDRLSLYVMEREIQNGLQKVAKITRPLMFSMHVHKYAEIVLIFSLNDNHSATDMNRPFASESGHNALLQQMWVELGQYGTVLRPLWCPGPKTNGSHLTDRYCSDGYSPDNRRERPCRHTAVATTIIREEGLLRCGHN
jgi:CBS domain-containing protein